MPLAKIHVLEGQYDKTRLGKIVRGDSECANRGSRVPTDDFFQIHHVLPRDRYRHNAGLSRTGNSDDMILLELTFITGGQRRRGWHS